MVLQTELDRLVQLRTKHQFNLTKTFITGPKKKKKKGSTIGKQELFWLF